MKIAVIGCGRQGRRHLAALAGSREVTGLVAADLDPDRAAAAAAQSGAACAASADAVFADPGIAAIVIATPTAAHLSLAFRAIAARKHFLCEKPFGVDAARARQAAREAMARGVVGRVGYLYRFAPAIAAARREAIALPEVDVARFVVAAPGGRAAWKHRRDSGGGAVNELASHMVDLALWFFGPMTAGAVLAKAQRRGRRVIDGVAETVDAEDRIVARLSQGDRVVVAIEANFAAPRFSQSLAIYGAERVIRATIEGAPDLYRRQAQAFIDAIGGRHASDACDLNAAAAARDWLDRMVAAPTRIDSASAA